MFPEETVQSQLLFLARLTSPSSAGWNGWKSPSTKRASWRASKGNPTFHDVLQKLVDAQVPVDALERSQESLQEIFLNLVGEEDVEA